MGLFETVLHCVKSVRIRSFSGPYFPALGSEKLRIQALSTECESLIYPLRRKK